MCQNLKSQSYLKQCRQLFRQIFPKHAKNGEHSKIKVNGVRDRAEYSAAGIITSKQIKLRNHLHFRVRMREIIKMLRKRKIALLILLLLPQEREFGEAGITLLILILQK